MHTTRPVAAPGDVQREFFGQRVSEPFEALTAAADPDVQAWADAQDRATTEWLARHADVATGRRFFERNFIQPDPPWHCRRGERLFRLEARPGLEQPVLVVAAGAGPAVDLVDADALDRALDIDQISVSPSGRYVSVCLQQPGSYPGEIAVYDVATRRLIERNPTLTVMPTVVWHPDERGFFYTLCARIFGGAPRPDGLYWHPLNTPWADDRCLLETGGEAARTVVAEVPEGGRWLLALTREFSTSRTGIALFALDALLAGPAARGQPLFELEQGYCEYIGLAGGRLHFHTCAGAPNGRMVAIDPERPAPAQWQTVVAEGEFPLARPERIGAPPKHVACAAGLLFTHVEHAHDVLAFIPAAGGERRRLEPPFYCCVDGVWFEQGAFRIRVQSFLVPRADFTFDPAAPGRGLVAAVRQAMPDLDPAGCELKLVFVTARDGTRLPVYLLHRRGQQPGTDAPLLLYGYGGFSQSITPEYKADAALWLSLGGVYALANIRGGGEYGEAWHRAGSGAQKQNTFNDFYDAAEFLIDRGWCRPGRLVARGLSNGGLLTAVCANQRPDLFAALISEVPLVDMLWLGDTDIGRAVAGEYGNPRASREMFEVLRSYSPVHNVRADGNAPATLVVMADRDTSAPPGQVYKYLATRQAAARPDAPVLLRVVRGEGHTTWPRDKTALALAEEVAFLRHFAAQPVR